MIVRGILGPAFVIAVAGCQASPPDRLPPLPPVSRDVLSHFRLDDDGAPAVETAGEESADGAPIPIIARTDTAGDPDAGGSDPREVQGPPEGQGPPQGQREAEAEGDLGSRGEGVAPEDREGDLADEPGADDLAIEDVLNSVERHFPLILAAMEEIEIAEGRMLEARGGFDTRLSAEGKFEPEGFYEKEIFELEVAQPTQLWGTTFSGGYRIGTGDFAVYEGGDKTNRGGEFRAGFNVPLLQGGSIDPRRVELWRSRIERDKAEPRILEKRLDATRKAATSYWGWVAAGRKRAIAKRLLDLARDRERQVELLVEEGQFAEIALVDNRRLIVEREASLVRTERALQEAAILLSLYWRDDEGRPALAGAESLPPDFPYPRPPEATLVDGDVAVALARRPEIRRLELELVDLGLDLDLARNALLPALDVGLFASQDVGSDVNDPDDKGPFELMGLLRFSMPLQMRSPLGRRRSLEAEITQLRRQAGFVRDVVETEVRDAVSALTQSWQRLAQARENVVLAARLEEAERLQLREGESDLFRVNLREQQSALAAAALVDVLAEHFKSLADYRAVLGIPYDEVRAGEDVGGTARPDAP